MVPPGDLGWHSWMTATALLGLDTLSQRVHPAFADGRVPSDVASEEHYRAILAAALEQPNDPELLNEENVGYIEDVLETLQGFLWDDDQDDSEHPSGEGPGSGR